VGPYIVGFHKKSYMLASSSGIVRRLFRDLLLNLSLTRSDYDRVTPQPTGASVMSQADYDTAVTQFLLTKGVTRCPTVCAVPTQATVADTDRAAYRDYVAAREAARLEKIKSLRHPVQPWPAPVVGANGDGRAPPRTVA
jgi:hypothetical protein